MTPEQKWMINVEELRELLRVSKSVAYQLVRRDDFPTLRIGKRILIPTEELRDWIKNNIIN